MTRAKPLKWRGLGESEYVSHCGTWLVHLHGRTWHLYRRVPLEQDSASHGPSWTWSPSLYQAKRKGACQEHAGTSPEAPANAPHTRPQAPREPAGPPGLVGRGPKGALSLPWTPSEPTHNARCHECGVPFTRDSKHRFGDLCGGNCLETLQEIVAEATP